MEQKSLTADDGVEIFYRRWVPDGEVRAVVLVVHGASEHSARYARFASVLNDEGYAVLAPDLRGHGRTASSTGTGRLGERGMEGVFADLDFVVDVARAEFSPAPIVLFGHSMGALVAQAYVERSGDRLAAFVLSGSRCRTARRRCARSSNDSATRDSTSPRTTTPTRVTNC